MPEVETACEKAVHFSLKRKVKTGRRPRKKKKEMTAAALEQAGHTLSRFFFLVAGHNFHYTFL